MCFAGADLDEGAVASKREQHERPQHGVLQVDQGLLSSCTAIQYPRHLHTRTDRSRHHKLQPQANSSDNCGKYDKVLDISLFFPSVQPQQKSNGNFTSASLSTFNASRVSENRAMLRRVGKSEDEWYCRRHFCPGSYIYKLVYQKIVIAALLRQNLLGSFPRLPFHETEITNNRLLSCAREVKCHKALWLQAREALWSKLKTDAIKRTEIFPDLGRRTYDQ